MAPPIKDGKDIRYFFKNREEDSKLYLKPFLPDLKKCFPRFEWKVQPLKYFSSVASKNIPYANQYGVMGKWENVCISAYFVEGNSSAPHHNTNYATHLVLEFKVKYMTECTITKKVTQKARKDGEPFVEDFKAQVEDQLQNAFEAYVEKAEASMKVLKAIKENN